LINKLKCFFGFHKKVWMTMCNGREHIFYALCKYCRTSLGEESGRCGKACDIFDPSLDTQEKITKKFLEEESNLI
jgi:hypothetical protein